MDNLAHSLVGAALGAAGLSRKTGLGMATLILAANLPDIDAFGILFGHNLAWRRGWTHGPVALLLLPPLLAALMLAFDRWQARRGSRPPSRAPVHFGWLVALAYIGAISHPMLDFLNTYGIRCLMPFSDRWYYGDALFIIDVWLWLALATGIWLTRRFRRGGPAIVALAATTLYAGGMGAASLSRANDGAGSRPPRASRSRRSGCEPGPDRPVPPRHRLQLRSLLRLRQPPLAPGSTV